MWSIGWGLTNQCNLNCEFCYSKYTREQSKEIIEKPVIINFINENFHLVKNINYGTGENTLSDIWIEIIRYVKAKFPSIVQALTTNGYLSQLCIDSKAEETIVNCLDEVDVSLDFAEREQHCKFRGNTDVYDWAMKTLELCKRYKKRISIVFVGTNDTLAIDNIKKLFEIAYKYDAIIRLNPYRAMHGVNDNFKKFIPNFNVIKEALEFISDHYKILSLSDPLFSAIFTNGDYKKIDTSGLSSVRILPDGSITPSTYLITPEFRTLNIKDKNVLNELAKPSFKMLIDRTIPDECAGCKYESVCMGGTLDRRYLWYNDFNRKDPYCPFNKRSNVEIKKLKVFSDNKFKSVHDGYLPTLFFSN